MVETALERMSNSDAWGARARSHSQEICEEFWAIDCEETLGVELHTFDVLAAIGEGAAQAHDNAAGAAGFGRFVSPGGNLPLRSISLLAEWNCLGKDHERVVAGCDKWVRESGEDAFTIVVDGAGFSVNLNGVPRDCHAVTGGETLVTEADTQDGDATSEAGDDVAGVAGFVGCAGARGDDDVSGPFAAIEGFNLIGRDLVVSNDENVAIEVDRWINFSESMHEIPGEGVVIVNK